MTVTKNFLLIALFVLIQSCAGPGTAPDNDLFSDTGIEGDIDRLDAEIGDLSDYDFGADTGSAELDSSGDGEDAFADFGSTGEEEDLFSDFDFSETDDLSTEVGDTGGDDPFADFDEGDIAGFGEIEEAPTGESAIEDEFASFDDFDNFEELLDQDVSAAPEEGIEPLDLFADFDNFEETPPQEPSTAAPSEDLFADTGETDDLFSVPDTDPFVDVPSPVISGSTRIQNIEYRAQEGNGTIVITGDGPLTYSTRTNDNLNQFIIEVQNADLPTRLQRPFDTSEFQSSIGSINAYQEPGSNTARIVVQLRDGASMPFVEQEGNTLLVLGPASGGGDTTLGSFDGGFPTDPTPTATPSQQNRYSGDEKILAAKSLEEFLSGNTQFYGKPISIETTEAMSLRDVFRLISEETGINLIIDDNVEGEVGMLKLVQVPWDQALHKIMRANKLGYTRQGNVLRIAQLAELRNEEAEVQKLREARKVVEPTRVQMIPISYAKMEDVVTQVTAFLTERGKVVGDPRTSSLIVTDVEENIAKISLLVKSLDIPPQQVLIEGKIIEATESFARRIGINWNLLNTNVQSGTLGYRQNFRSVPALPRVDNLHFDFSLGTFDSIGDLSARLQISEREDEAKIISSPRIVTLHNEKAAITQITQIPMISIDEEGRRAVNFTPVNLKLDVTPQITSDDSVILGVDVLREFAGAEVEQETMARPINSRGAVTRVLVKNGDTAVIGGIYQNDTTQVSDGLPILKDIPFIGGLFRANATNRNRTELLIFLTPRVLNSDATSSAGGTGGTRLQ